MQAQIATQMLMKVTTQKVHARRKEKEEWKCFMQLTEFTLPRNDLNDGLLS